MWCQLWLSSVMESFHAALRQRVKVAHPNLYTFLGHLQRITTYQQTEVERINTVFSDVAGLYIIFLRTRVVSCRIFSHITDVNFRTYTFGSCPSQLYSHYFHVSHFQSPRRYTSVPSRSSPLLAAVPPGAPNTKLWA